MDNRRKRLPVVKKTLARLHLLMHKGLVHASDQRVILMEVRDFHPKRVLNQNCPLSLDLQLGSILIINAFILNKVSNVKKDFGRKKKHIL